MAKAALSFEPFDCSIAKEVHCPLEEYQRYEEESKGKQAHFLEATDWGDLNYLCSEYDLYQEKSFDKGIAISNNQQPASEFLMTDDMQHDVVSSIIQEFFQEPVKLDAGLDYIEKSTNISNPEIDEYKKEKAHPIPLASLELLNSYRTGTKILNGEDFDNSTKEEPCHVVVCSRLSTEEVMRVAGARYIQFSVQTDDDLSVLGHPYSSMDSTLTDEETKDVELGHLLLASAEKIGNQQYERASKLLTQCEHMSSIFGNPVQRVVYHFSEALRERINRETGRVSSKGPKNGKWREDIKEVMMSPHPALLASHQMLPFGQVAQFTAIQVILDNMASAKRVHLIDLGIRIGVQWSILMQALAVRFTCPIELVKITAVGTPQGKIEETGERLVSFAKTLNLPFTFKPVIVSDMKDLNRDLFELVPEEAVGIYAPWMLNTMICRPECLDHLMRVIRSFNPCIMVVTEIEANHNSPSFVNRFIEALFFFSAWFDCYDTCMDRNDHNRMSIEGIFFSQGIRNIVTAEGSERIVRHVGIDVWRSFFARFGFVEIELNHLYQASLLLKQFACGSSCTLDMNGKSLSTGWKGTPLLAVSAWKVK